MTRIGTLLMTLTLFLTTPVTRGAESPLNLDPIDRYILAWEKSGGMESASRHHIHDFLTLLGVPTPDSPRPDLHENVYTYEMTHRITNPDGSVSTGNSDLCYEGHVLLEMKQGHHPDQRKTASGGPFRRGHAARGTPQWDTMMIDSREQAFRYALSMHESVRPPFVIVWDLGYQWEIYSDLNFTGQYTAFPAPGRNRFRLEELRDEKVRDMMRRIWLDPYSLDPMRETHRVTHEVARFMGRLALSLEEGNYDAEESALFVARCIFTMLAEDVRLLRNNTFLDILKECRTNPEAFVPKVTTLWRDMYTGGYSELLGRRLWEFGGDDFFKDATAPVLDVGQIDILIQAAECQWYHVDPVVQSSLVEAALSADKRLGAFYTHPAYAEKINLPAVIDPLREKWAETIREVQTLVAGKDFETARKKVREFHQFIVSKRVLDANCGSANFLATSLSEASDNANYLKCNVM